MTKSKDIFTRAISKNSSWPDREELLDVVYWARQMLAILIGFIWGVFNLTGILAILLYVVLTALLLNGYVSTYQKEDIEDYGGFMEVAKEGFMSSFATFLVMWIIVYSSLHWSN